MTIKEVEGKSGMTRANIRFYETEGLLSPVRAANGYRDYSQQDVEILKKIQLLRSLHISLEEIKALHTGEKELTEVLKTHIADLGEEKNNTEKAQAICNLMQEESVSYESLNAQKYLERLSEEIPVPAIELKQDSLPKVEAPWQRFFARGIDLFMGAILPALILLFVCKENIFCWEWMIFCGICCLLMPFIWEPVFLCLWGTTPGKFIFGIRVTDYNGGRLSYVQALERTCSVMCYGVGFQIPVLNLYRGYRSYKKCRNAEKMEWDYDSELVLKDKKKWRYAAMAAFYGIAAVLLYLGVLVSLTPIHKGDLTVAEFCENYNQYADYFHIDSGNPLTEDGKWSWAEGDIDYDQCLRMLELPDVEIIGEDGVVTGLEMKMSIENSDEQVPAYQEEMALAILAFLCAQEEYELYSPEVARLLKDIEERPFSGSDRIIDGIRVEIDYDFYGYDYSEDYYGDPKLFVIREGAFYKFSFTITKQ